MFQCGAMVLGVIGLLVAAAGTAAALSYQAIDISALDGNITGAAEAKAISSDGKYVTGYATYADGQHAFLYNTVTSVYQDLGTNGTTGLQGWGVNASGQIVASASNIGYYYSGGVWNSLAATLQAHVPSGTVNYANPYAITNGGMILGGFRDETYTGRSNQVGFEYTIGSSATVAILPVIAPANTTTAAYATAISSNGAYITGQSPASANPTPIHAFLYDGTTISDLGGLSGGTDTRAYGVNSSGTVVGRGYPGGEAIPNPYCHGFYATAGGVLHDIGSLFPPIMDPIGDVKAQGISNNGLAIGYSPLMRGGQHAFIFDTAAPATAMVDLNDYLAAGSPWTLNTADAITPDAIGAGNWIVGGGDYNGSAYSHAFLLRPTAMPGDANLDGKVDIADLSILLTNFDKSRMSWGQGDFDHSGTVDIADLSNLLTNFDKSVALSPTVTRAVPEPSALVAALAAALLGTFVWACRKEGILMT